MSDQHVYKIRKAWSLDHGLRLAFYQENDAWEIEKPVMTSLSQRTWDNNSLYEVITIHLGLKRRNLFHVLLFLIPNSILYLLSGLVYLIPVDSGEKVSFAVTVLLAQFCVSRNDIRLTTPEFTFISE